MLTRLSGKTHQVYTGFCVRQNEKSVCEFVCTEVTFRSLEAAEILGYIKTEEPFDKAGAYGIQGFGALLVEDIQGCYFNVMGLPIGKLFQVLKQEFQVFIF